MIKKPGYTPGFWVISLLEVSGLGNVTSALDTHMLIVIYDGNFRSARHSQASVDWPADLQRECLIAFHLRVVDDGHAEGLHRDSRRKGETALDIDEVCPTKSSDAAASIFYRNGIGGGPIERYGDDR